MIGHTLALVLLLGVTGAVRAASPPSAAGAKEELRELKARIEAVQQKLSESEGTRSEAADALKQSERAISEATRALADLTEQSRMASTRLAGIRREKQQRERDLKAQEAALSKLLYERYIAGRPDALAILLNGGDPNAVARRLHYLTYIGQAQSRTIASVRAEVAALAKLTADAQNEAATIAAVTAQQAAERRRLDQEKRARTQMLTRISHDIEKQRREIETLKRDEARLARLIGAARAGHRPDTEAQAETAARDPRAVGGARTARLTRSHRARAGAGGAGGRVQPVAGPPRLTGAGELANRFGSPRQDGGLTWKGLFIAARAGEEVRAIAAGRVVYADWLRGFGNLLIIDHGDSYMSLYGYNETLFRQVGDLIRAGERIAAVGNTGGHPDSGLYFEMRHEGRPFDPMTWVSVR